MMELTKEQRNYRNQIETLRDNKEDIERKIQELRLNCQHVFENQQCFCSGDDYKECIICGYKTY